MLMSMEWHGKTITWESGYVGTSDYRRDCREARETTTNDAIDQARRDGRAVVTDGGFAGCLLPHGRGETVATVAHVAARDTGYGVAPMSVRRRIRDARVEGRARRARRAVMVAARQAERVRRFNVRAAAEWSPVAPLEWMRADIARGRYSLSTSLVQEKVTLRDDAGIARIQTIIEAPRYMVALERLTLDYLNAHRAYDVMMRHVPSGEGRGTVDRAPSSVNGTETRVASRWHGTPRHALMTHGETRHGVTCVHPIDWTCYRITAHGREALVSSATARKRKTKVSTKVSASTARATLAAVAGTLGVDAQG